MISAHSVGFDIEALHAALDAQRQERGLSWQAAANQISGQFANVPGRVNASTITSMRSRRVIEGDGVLQMLLWLNRTPESFITGIDAREIETAPLEHVGPDRILRFDTRAIHAALDAQRAERNMTWKQVAGEIGGIAPTGLTRLAQGGRTSFPDIMRIAVWLKRPVATLTRASE